MRYPTQWRTEPRIISYRGTDLNYGLYNSLADIFFGWLGGSGLLTPQFAAAANFYRVGANGQSILSGTNSSVVLTGHSLGGGLAGYVAALTGDQAAVFDWMPYAAAAFRTYFNDLLTAPYPNGSNITTEMPQARSLLEYATLQPIEAAAGGLFENPLSAAAGFRRRSHYPR